MNIQLKEIVHKITSNFPNFKILSFTEAQEYYGWLYEGDYGQFYVSLIMNISSDVELILFIVESDSHFSMRATIYCHGYSDYQDGETYEFLQDEDDMQMMFTACTYKDDLILYTYPYYYLYSEYDEMITNLGFIENFAYKITQEVEWI